MDVDTLHRLKVTLAHIRPSIWRRLLVPSAFTLADLHEVLQAAFGWEDCHLHDFRDARTRYGVPDPGVPTPLVDESTVDLGDVLPRKGSRLDYVYDYGDDWLHRITVEAIEEPSERATPHALRRRKPRTVTCLGAARAAPPENCGGPPGYAQLLESLEDPEHDVHAELFAWVGGPFDPESASLAEINARIAKM